MTHDCEETSHVRPLTHATKSFLVASAKAPVGDFLIKGAMVLPQNVSCVQGLAAGMSQDAAKFPFEKPLPEIVAACAQ